MTIVREAVTILREEIRSELQSFYERISTLIERSSVHPPPPHTATAILPDAAPAPGAAPCAVPAPGAASAVADASVPSSQAEKEADTLDGTAHAADTHAPAADPPTDMVSFF